GHHGEDRHPQRLRGLDRDALGENAVGGEAQVGVLLGAAQREHGAVVARQVLLDLPPVERRDTHAGYDSSWASSVISVLSRREMGQPALASPAALSKAARSAPGTRARVTRWMRVIVQPASSLSKSSWAVVRMLCGVSPAPPSCAERAIEKQAACAAATSSSGLVPVPDSKRSLN